MHRVWSRAEGTDLVFTPAADEATANVRCLRERCRITVTPADGPMFLADLDKGESTELPLESGVEVAFAPQGR